MFCFAPSGGKRPPRRSRLATTVSVSLPPSRSVNTQQADYGGGSAEGAAGLRASWEMTADWQGGSGGGGTVSGG